MLLESSSMASPARGSARGSRRSYRPLAWARIGCARSTYQAKCGEAECLNPMVPIHVLVPFNDILILSHKRFFSISPPLNPLFN
jgi:hypothetical protein